MTGQEIIDWIQENEAEDDEIYIEVERRLFRQTEEFMVLGDEDYPCMDMIVLR